MSRKVSLAALVLLIGMAGTAFAGGSGGADLANSMAAVAVQLGVILLAARLGNWLMERLGLPGIIGQVLAGILIGPFLIGSVPFHGFPSGLFPAGGSFPVSSELFGLCAVASVLFLFVRGLETDIKLLRGHVVAGSLVGASGAVVAFVLGDLVAVALSREVLHVPADFFSPQCLFLGVLCTATSAGIAVRILSNARRLDSPEGAAILAANVVDGILTVVLLAGTLGVVTTSRADARFAGVGDGLIAWRAAGIWLVLLVVGLAASRQIGALLKVFRDKSTIALMALGIAFILSGLFGRTGLAVVVGAYVVGISLSQSDIGLLVRERIGGIYGFFMPVLFCVIGMMTNVRVLGRADVILFAGVFCSVAIAAKLAGCGISSLACGFNPRGAIRIGEGMIARGGLALLIAGIGLTGGILTHEMASVAVVMVFASVLIGMPLAGIGFGGDSDGTRKPSERGVSKRIEFAFPSPEIAESVVVRLLSVFESEGFTVHLLDRSWCIYQVRKADMTIGIRQVGTNILLDCSDDEAPLANTGIYEAVADFEKVIMDLRKAVDGKAIARRLEEGTQDAHWKMSLADYLKPETIRANLNAKTKDEVLEELLGILAAQGYVSDVDEARKAIRSREESMSTGMQHGIAIPHGKTDAAGKLVCAMGLKREGIDFMSLDGELSKIFILVLSPQHVVAPYMQLMASISRSLTDSVRSGLLACTTEQEVMAVLRGDSPVVERRVETVVRSQKAEPAGELKPGDGLLADYIRPELVVLQMDATTKAEVIDEMLHLLEENGRIKDFKDARKAVMERESKMSTGIQDGIAIPHARTSAVSALVCAVGIKRGGIDFDSIDGKPCSIFVMTLSPKEVLAPHIQFMAMISRALNEGGRKAVYAAKTRQEVCDILTRRAPGLNGAPEQRRQG